MKENCFLLCLFFITTMVIANDPNDSLQAEDTPERFRYSTHFIPIQYAGNIGLISGGIGYASQRDTYQLSLVYGYVPPSVGGVKIHTISVKNVFHLTRFHINETKTIVPYAALGVSLEVGGRSWFFLPENMPPGYYSFPKSIHAIPGLGIKLRTLKRSRGFFTGAEFFAEASSVDVNVWYKFISNEVKMNQIVSLALGVNLLRH